MISLVFPVRAEPRRSVDVPARQLESAHRAEVSAGGKTRTRQHNGDENTRRICVFRAVLTRSALTPLDFNPTRQQTPASPHLSPPPHRRYQQRTRVLPRSPPCHVHFSVRRGLVMDMSRHPHAGWQEVTPRRQAASLSARRTFLL